MRLQFDDLALQTVDQLKKQIPQGSAGPPAVPAVANIVIMENAAEQIEQWFNSKEISQIMVTYSGSNTEGSRHIEDFVITMDPVTQRLMHTIEVHICCKRYMLPDLITPNTMLRLMFAVQGALLGLKFYSRDDSGNVVYSRITEQTFGMILIESFVDRNYPGVVSVCRFQVQEIISQMDFDLEAPTDVWGQYKEFTFQDYAQPNGATPDISGPPTVTEVVINET